MNAIELNGVTKSFSGFTLDNLTLTLPSGCIMGLVGENGAGKSTTMKLLLDMIPSDSGTIQIFGKAHTQLNKEEIGVVMDEIGIPDCLKAHQIGTIMNNIYTNWDINTYESLLKRLSIPTTKKFKEFSRGMKMKMGIAIALSHHAKLLILDEATSGLDPVVRDDVLDILNEFTREEGNSILVSSHIVSDLEKICDYITFLHQGKLILSEEKDLLYEKYGFIQCSKEEFSNIPSKEIKGKKITPYGVEAIVNRNAIPHGVTVHPITIEELFIFMAKGEH